MNKKENDATLDAILELANSQEKRSMSIMALSLNYMVERCKEEYGKEPPPAWNTREVIHSMDFALKTAYRYMIVEKMSSKTMC